LEITEFLSFVRLYNNGLSSAEETERVLAVFILALLLRWLIGLDECLCIGFTRIIFDAYVVDFAY
jgi:hypothetical protein